MHNYFGLSLEFSANQLRKLPLISTWFAAFFLSTVWTISWLIVFFATTWFFNLKTNATDLINVFWLSIAAEAVIRWAENSNFVAAISKPLESEPRGDNQDFRLTRALILFLAALVGMFFFDFYLEKIGLKGGNFFFHGQGSLNGYDQVNNMVITWWNTISTTGISAPLVVGLALRAVIYKRSHSTAETPKNTEGDTE